MSIQQFFVDAFQSLVNGVVDILPKLFLAIFVFIIGWVFARLVYRLVIKFANITKLNALAKPLNHFFERSGYKMNLGKLIAFLLKWFIVIGSLVVSLQILNLPVKNLLIEFMRFGIKVIFGILILVVGITLADFVKKLVKGSTKILNVRSAGLLANIAKITIIIFTVIFTLDFVGVDTAVINTLYIGVVSMFTLAGGLAFGLGGQRAAAELIDDIQESLHK